MPTSSKLDTSHLTANEEADLRCRTALELKDQGKYDAARRTMFPLWKGIGSRPNTMGLSAEVVPRVLLCAGILTGWHGGVNGIEEVDEYARDLLTESIRLFEDIGDSRKAAEAKAELARCYWLAGANDEARILLSTALERLTTGGNARARALLVLSSVEWAESRYKEVLRILTQNAPLFEGITNHTIKGTYHNQFGITLRSIGAASKKRADYFQRAISEYRAADEQFRLARHAIFRAHVTNNIGNVLRDLGRFKDAHQYLEQARRLFMRLRDSVRTSQVDDTRAQVFIAERKYAEAEQIARNAARSFERAGRQCFLAEALITQGIAVARVHEDDRARFIFQRAIEIAHQAGSLSVAGLAALTMIEELNSLSGEVQSVAYAQAREWLANRQSPDTKPRLKAVRKKIGDELLRGKPKNADVREVLFNKRCDLEDEVLKFERKLISETLAKVNGQVTDAAELLNVGYQRLAHRIETKHPDLLKKRTPVRRRRRNA
jgi:tetratricopeptide (TPR) repeat protein